MNEQNEQTLPQNEFYTAETGLVTPGQIPVGPEIQAPAGPGTDEVIQTTVTEVTPPVAPSNNMISDGVDFPKGPDASIDSNPFANLEPSPELKPTPPIAEMQPVAIKEPEQNEQSKDPLLDAFVTKTNADVAITGNVTVEAPAECVVPETAGTLPEIPEAPESTVKPRYPLEEIIEPKYEPMNPEIIPDESGNIFSRAKEVLRDIHEASLELEKANRELDARYRELDKKATEDYQSYRAELRLMHADSKKDLSAKLKKLDDSKAEISELAKEN